MSVIHHSMPYPTNYLHLFPPFAPKDMKMSVTWDNSNGAATVV